MGEYSFTCSAIIKSLKPQKRIGYNSHESSIGGHNITPRLHTLREQKNIYGTLSLHLKKVS